MKRFLCLSFCFLFSILSAFAEEPKILEYNKENKTIKVKIEGKEYLLDVPQETREVVDQTLQGKVQKKKYAISPSSTKIGARLYNIPNDILTPKGSLSFDFAHRFSSPIKSETASDVYGLDSFAYTGLGLYYGITNFLEAHAFRSSVTDASEVGFKLALLREARKFGEGSPVGLTLSTGFQNDNLQDSIDFFIQPILSKVVIPKWLKVYLAPTWADHSSTIGSKGSKSAIFFPFIDPKKRKPSKDPSTFALPIGVALQIFPDRLSLFGEYTPVLAGYKEVKNGFAFGLQILSRLETHVWTIGISNVPYSTFGQFIVGGPSNDLFLGFNISARIK